MLYVFNHARFCDSTCGFCAREFWKWYKSRMTQMSFGPEGGPAFADAAATSIRPAQTDSGNSTSQYATSCHTSPKHNQ